MRRFSSSSGHGYVDVECATRSFSVPSTFTAALICSIDDMPVESITGRPVSRMACNSFLCVRHAEATLWHGGSNCSMNSTEGTSHGEANQAMLFSRQYASMARYCSRL